MYIGIDLGTTSVKLLLVTNKGIAVKSISKSYDLIIPQPSWTEQNPMDWYEQTIAGLKEIVVGYENEIQGMSFSGQMHGLVVLDRDDQSLRNAILWNDQRTVSEVEYLNTIIGIPRLLELTGNIALTGLTAPKLLWIKNNEPDVFRQISKIMLPKDYIAYKLTGVFATDVSDASGTLYFDVKNKRFSQEMMKIIGIRDYQLPQVFESYQVIGTLKIELQELLNLKNEVKITIGGGDQAVGAVGVGIVDSGTCSISLGTSGVVFVASDEFKIDHKNYLQSYAHSNGKYHLMGVMLNAAGSLKWWNEKIFQNYNYDDFFSKLEKTPINDSIFFLPYLTGERSPINNPYATGVFLGLRIEHRKEHMDRAVIEGVTFALRESFELIKNLGVKINSVKLTGGGAKSEFWAQLIADILNIEVITIKIEEGPAFGAAILAMVGSLEFETVDDACRQLIIPKRSFSPNKKNVGIYESKYQSFIKIYPIIKTLF